jgi:hypothetical protein
MRLTGTCVLVLSVFAFAGSAYAGNGNGNGNGTSGGAGATDAAPGNSANAPGQLKKDAPPEDATTATTATTTVVAESAPTSEGVKPSSETPHDTHAEAQSNQTKEYGNGQTAGQIARKNGAAATTVLHGPGNSQPHKASPCSGGHEVDVHALKAHRAGRCGGDPPQPTPAPVPQPGTTTTPTVTTKSEQDPPARDPGVADPKDQPGVVVEAAGEVASASSEEGDSQGVLAETQRLGRTASLPFTGQPLWAVVLLGLILIATGLGLREIQTAEAAVESGHEHTDRARDPARGSRPPVGGRTGR